MSVGQLFKSEGIFLKSDCPLASIVFPACLEHLLHKRCMLCQEEEPELQTNVLPNEARLGAENN